jgi:hypothetical protein
MTHTVGIFDVVTGIQIEREMNAEELEQYQIDQETNAKAKAEAQAKAEAKASAEAKLKALGLTTEDLKALGL